MRFLALTALVGIVAIVVWAAYRPAGDEPAKTPVAILTTSTTTTVPELENLGTPKQLVAIDGWLQSDVTSLEELRGQVVVVQFWTFACHNCKATLDNLAALYAEHRDDGLEVVGIHSPEFEFEEDVDNITAAAADLGVTWPIALDTTQRTFFHWQGSPAYWPRTYVLDREGDIRFDHIGEGKYDELNATVRFLLEQPA